MKKEDTYFNEEVEFDEEGRPIEQKKNLRPVALIPTVLLLLWFAGSVLLMLKFARISGSEWKCIVTFGQLFAVFGAFACISEYSGKKKVGFGSVAAVMIGVVIVAAAVAFHMGGDDVRTIMVKGGAVLFLLIFVFVGLSVLWSELSRIKRFRESCSQPVEGVCCGFNETTHTRNGKRVTVTAPVYEIYYEGERIELADESFAADQYIMVGDKKELMIDPKNPHIFRDPNKKERIEPALLLWVAMFTGVPLFILIVMISLF